MRTTSIVKDKVKKKKGEFLETELLRSQTFFYSLCNTHSAVENTTRVLGNNSPRALLALRALWVEVDGLSPLIVSIMCAVSNSFEIVSPSLRSNGPTDLLKAPLLSRNLLCAQVSLGNFGFTLWTLGLENRCPFKKLLVLRLPMLRIIKPCFLWPGCLTLSASLHDSGADSLISLYVKSPTF